MKHNNRLCAICGETYDWKEPHSLLVVQTGESDNQATVFEAHAALEGLCGNLIDALKLLANLQQDGDCFMQNIVTPALSGEQEGPTNGLRDFKKIDNHSDLEVGHLNQSLGFFKCTKTETTRTIPRGDCLGEPRRIDAASRGSGHVEVIHQCRPHRKGGSGSSFHRC